MEVVLFENKGERNELQTIWTLREIFQKTNRLILWSCRSYCI